ncbi:MAG: T9SS type A sorting domain-containing protein, partial [Bacteroidales bacterium]|nr:T9SS type A sorting domain-containing protein [Bacteroidales bacterium]
YGSTVLLEALPDAGYRFARWESESQEIDGPQALLPLLGVRATEDISLTAVFEPLKYTIGTQVSPLGTGTVTTGGEFDYGAAVSFEARPDANHVFHAWTLNGEVVSTEAVLKTEVKEDAAYVAVFTPKRYNVVTSVYPERGGVAYGGGSYYWGDTAHIGIYLYDSVTFKKWNNADFVQVSTQPEYDYIVSHTEIFTASVDAPIPVRDDDTVPPIHDTTGRYIKVYPNPVGPDGILTIESNEENLSSIRIYALTGQHLLYRKLSDKGISIARIRLTPMAPGCYFYEIKTVSGGSKRGKLIRR